MSTTDEHRAATPSTSPSATPPAPSAAVPGGSQSVRASDAEREAAVARLHQALGEGRLDLGEVETRITAAYAARNRDELPPLLADLPPSATTAVGPSAAPTWATLATGLIWRLRLLLLGEADAAAAPTPAQRRRIALLAVGVVAWLAACALLGAVLA